MEFSNLEKLEQKLSTFVVRMQKLQSEVIQLREENAAMRILLKDREQTIQQLEEEMVRLREAESRSRMDEARDEQIRAKISEMLKKLDLLENSLTES